MNSNHTVGMRIFLFLTVFYISIISFGLITANASDTADCTDLTCIEDQLPTNGEVNVDELESKLQALLASIQEKIGPEKINDLIQNAVKTNPQIAQLVKLVQEYGVLTDIELDDSMTEPSGEGE